MDPNINLRESVGRAQNYIALKFHIIKFQLIPKYDFF